MREWPSLAAAEAREGALRLLAVARTFMAPTRRPVDPSVALQLMVCTRRRQSGRDDSGVWDAGLLTGVLVTRLAGLTAISLRTLRRDTPTRVRCRTLMDFLSRAVNVSIGVATRVWGRVRHQPSFRATRNTHSSRSVRPSLRDLTGGCEGDCLTEAAAPGPTRKRKGRWSCDTSPGGGGRCRTAESAGEASGFRGAMRGGLWCSS